jgi:hypothetical protein
VTSCSLKKERWRRRRQAFLDRVVSLGRPANFDAQCLPPEATSATDAALAEAVKSRAGRRAVAVRDAMRARRAASAPGTAAPGGDSEDTEDYDSDMNGETGFDERNGRRDDGAAL